MNDIFSNLAMRNSGLPSPEVLQPRLPTLFDPASLLTEPTGSLLDKPMPFLMSTVSGNETGQSTSMLFDHESSLPGKTLIQEASPDIPIKHQRPDDHPSKSRDESPAREITILRPDQPMPQESIYSSSTMASSDELQNDLRRSETDVSHAERGTVRNHKNDSQWKKENVEERVVRPRMESLAANKAEGNSQSPRSAPGGGEKSMNRVLPHEESHQEEVPVVRIHIGRIEVRAITPAPAQPASKPAPAQPRLTLDDYLRQREARR